MKSCYSFDCMHEKSNEAYQNEQFESSKQQCRAYRNDDKDGAEYEREREREREREPVKSSFIANR